MVLMGLVQWVFSFIVTLVLGLAILEQVSIWVNNKMDRENFRKNYGETIEQVLGFYGNLQRIKYLSIASLLILPGVYLVGTIVGLSYVVVGKGIHHADILLTVIFVLRMGASFAKSIIKQFQ